MSATDLAAIIVAMVAIVALVAVLVATLLLVTTLRSLRSTLEAFRTEAGPAVAELRQATHLAHHELTRFDDLLDTAESISATVDSASRLGYRLITSPVIKTAAAGAGAGRFARRLGRGH